MFRTLVSLLALGAMTLSMGCQTPPSSMPDDIGNMMPEGERTLSMWGWVEMCADPARYQPELCPAKDAPPAPETDQ